MSESGHGDEGKPEDTRITPKAGKVGLTGEGVVLRVEGPGRDGIRTSDSLG
jgi:hypothetical protein